MQKFNVYNPTQIIFGEGRIAELAEHIAADARVMVLYIRSNVRGRLFALFQY